MGENFDHICGHDLYKRAINAGVSLFNDDINFLNSPELVILERLESKQQILLEDQINLIEEKGGLLTEKYKAILDKSKIFLENDENNQFNDLYIKNLDKKIEKNDIQNDYVKSKLSKNEKYLLILKKYKRKDKK